MPSRPPEGPNASLRPRRAVLAIAVLLAACKVTDDASFRRASADRLPAPAGSSARAELDPGDEPIPEGQLGTSIRRGRAIVMATRDSLPRNVGNELRCVSCHLDEGRRPFAMPWTGVVARYPQYLSRSNRVESIEDRINGCFRRSLAGRPLAADASAMRDIVAYFAHLSRGVPVGTTVTGQGVDSVKAPERGDTARGRVVYRAQCERCHGASGEGVRPNPPLWGRHSFTIASGMARWRLAAAFIGHNKTGDRRESLSTREAVDVAVFLAARTRPRLAGQEGDWPLGNEPDDVPYRTTASRLQRAARARPGT